MVAVLAAGACGPSFPSPGRTASQPVPPRGAQPGPGPARGVFPPNATRVIATVQKVSGDTLTLEILEARQARPVVSIVGDTLASRWLISEIRPLPDR